VIICKSHSKYI